MIETTRQPLLLIRIEPWRIGYTCDLAERDYADVDGSAFDLDRRLIGPKQNGPFGPLGVTCGFCVCGAQGEPPPIAVSRPGCCCAGDAFATCDACVSSSSLMSEISAKVSAASTDTHWPAGNISVSYTHLTLPTNREV